jgi:hypothetical protein
MQHRRDARKVPIGTSDRLRGGCGHACFRMSQAGQGLRRLYSVGKTGLPANTRCRSFSIRFRSRIECNRRCTEVHTGCPALQQIPAWRNRIRDMWQKNDNAIGIIISPCCVREATVTWQRRPGANGHDLPAAADPRHPAASRAATEKSRLLPGQTGRRTTVMEGSIETISSKAEPRNAIPTGKPWLMQSARSATPTDCPSSIAPLGPSSSDEQTQANIRGCNGWRNDPLTTR